MHGTRSDTALRWSQNRDDAWLGCVNDNSCLGKPGPQEDDRLPARARRLAWLPGRSCGRTTTARGARTEAEAEAQDKKELPSDYNQETREIWEAVRDRTMTHHARVNFLIQAVRYVERHRVPGAVVECGVWRGGSMLTVAHTLLRLGVTDRDLYLFDTFEGMTEPTERDVRITQGKHADELLEGKGPGPMAWARPGKFVATLDDVKEGFSELDYPDDRVHFVPGRVEDTVPELRPRGHRDPAARHRLVRVDQARAHASVQPAGTRGRADHRRLRHLARRQGGHRRVPREDRGTVAADPGCTRGRRGQTWTVASLLTEEACEPGVGRSVVHRSAHE